METVNSNDQSEVLEYESDDDNFESQYVESQMGIGIDDGITNNIESNISKYDQEENTYEGEQQFKEDFRDIQDEKDDFSEDDYIEDNEYNDEKKKDNDENEKEKDNNNNNNNNNNINGADSTINNSQTNYEEHSKEARNDSNDSDNSNNNNKSDTDKEATVYPKNEASDDSSLSKLRVVGDQNIEDPFDDDELIEYVDDTNDETNWDLDNEVKDLQDSQNLQVKNTIDFPIYLDFCELFTTNGSNMQSLEGKWLDDKIKVDFDFMKLYQPECTEDEIYSEIDSVFDNIDECIELTFNEILFKIKDIIIQNCECEIEEIDIHLTFGDLMNLSISSDSILSESLTLREVLNIYENLKSQSPNADLYKFLSIKVSLSRNILGQLRILEKASFNGYGLENLDEIANNKRSFEEISGCNIIVNGADEFEEKGNNEKEDYNYKRVKFE
ncbi:hypothetical protein C6P42_001755 [Pichia californica]|nr:hypothetical protein C6P42_001755 [[Candida] californica]